MRADLTFLSYIVCYSFFRRHSVIPMWKTALGREQIGKEIRGPNSKGQGH